MWPLVRLVALALIAVAVLLAAGQGAWLPGLGERGGGPVGLGSLPGDGAVPALRARVGGLAAGLALGLGAHRLVGQLATLLHELGHTVTAAALGARPSGIVLRHDASGHATARWTIRPGPVRRLALAATAVVGLPAPAVTAAAGAGLLTVAGPRPVLWATAAAGAVVALLARSAWSLVVAVALVGLAVAGLSEMARPWAGAVVVAALTALAAHAAVGALGRLGRPIPRGDDAEAVRRRLRVPARLVQVGQVLGTLGASARALWLLVAPLGWPPSGW